MKQKRKGKEKKRKRKKKKKLKKKEKPNGKQKTGSGNLLEGSKSRKIRLGNSRTFPKPEMLEHVNGPAQVTARSRALCETSIVRRKMRRIGYSVASFHRRNTTL